MASSYLPFNRCPACRFPGEASKSCAGCQNVRYCSTECQQADWLTHKLLCRGYKSFAERPSATMRRVMVLRHDGEGPEFAWMDVEVREGGLVAPVDVEGVLGVADAPVRVVVREQTLLRALLPYALCVFCVTVMDDIRKPVNRAAAKLVAGRSKHQWRGSMVVMMGARDAFQPGTSFIDGVQDIDLNHLSDIVAFLLDKQGQDPAHVARTRYGQQYTKVTACKVFCHGGIRDLDGEINTEVTIPPAHYMFESEDNIAPLSRLIGVPLHVVKYSSSKPYVGADLSNNVAAQMMRTIESDSFSVPLDGAPAFGLPAKEWLGHPGHVLVARQDRQPLEEVFVGAFGNFCQFHFEAYHRWGLLLAKSEATAQGLIQEADIKAAVLRRITPETWAEYLFAYTSMAEAASRGVEIGGQGKASEEFDAMFGEFSDCALDSQGSDDLVEKLIARTWEHASAELSSRRH